MNGGIAVKSIVTKIGTFIQDKNHVPGFFTLRYCSIGDGSSPPV
jgi:hypothetical protein